MALEVKRETFLQKPGNYFRDSQAAGYKQQGSSASEGAEEWTRLSRSHAADFPSLSNACSVAYRTVCSQFFLRNNLFCSKFRTTRWSGALGHPKKKTFLLSRKSLSVNRPGFAKKLGGLQLVYGHVPIEISYNERHTPTPATEFPFIYLFIYLLIYLLFSQIQSELSNNFSINFFKYLRRCLSYAMNMTASNHNNKKRRGTTIMATASPPDTWINNQTKQSFSSKVG